MDPKETITQNDFLLEMEQMSITFGLDMTNFSENLVSNESYPTNKPEIYECPWDNQGDIILFV